MLNGEEVVVGVFMDESTVFLMLLDQKNPATRITITAIKKLVFAERGNLLVAIY